MGWPASPYSNARARGSTASMPRSEPQKPMSGLSCSNPCYPSRLSIPTWVMVRQEEGLGTYTVSDPTTMTVLPPCPPPWISWDATSRPDHPTDAHTSSHRETEDGIIVRHDS